MKRLILAAAAALTLLAFPAAAQFADGQPAPVAGAQPAGEQPLCAGCPTGAPTAAAFGVSGCALLASANVSARGAPATSTSAANAMHAMVRLMRSPPEKKTPPSQGGAFYHASLAVTKGLWSRPSIGHRL